MKISLEEKTRLAMPKWEILKSYSKTALKDDALWETSLEYVFENGDELAVKGKFSDAPLMPSCTGFLLLYVRIPYEADAKNLQLAKLITREKIIGWQFERWFFPTVKPITLSGVQEGGASPGSGHFAIMFPDGLVQTLGYSTQEGSEMRIVPASYLLTGEKEWLAGIKAMTMAAQEHERAFETGKDADGNPTCQQFFGGCPTCGTSGILNVGRSHWGICDTHKTKWPIGSNLFSDWRYETENEWQANSAQLATYTKVAPLEPGATIPKPELEKSANGMGDATGIDGEIPF